MRIDRTLYNAQQANATINEAYQAIKPHLMDGSQFSLQIKPKTRSTSQMSVREMSDLMELMSAFGAEHNVRFTAPEYA